MRKYKEVTKTITSKQLDKITCDLCGKEAKDTDWDSGSIYTVNETEVTVTVKQKEGYSCSDSGWGTGYAFDICPDCFKDILVPFLRSKGVVIEETEWNW